MSSRPQPGSTRPWQHAMPSRRNALQAGAIGILGLGMNHLAGCGARLPPMGSARMAKPKPVFSSSSLEDFRSTIAST